MSKLKNLILSITLIIIFLIDFGLIVTTNIKWNETIKEIHYVSIEFTAKDDYIKNALERRKTEFTWTISLFLLANIMGIILLYLYRKDKKIYEKSLYEEKEKAITTLRSIGDAVITIDDKAEITFINPISEKILAYTNSEVIGKNICEVLNLIDNRTKKEIKLHLEKVLQQGKIRILSNHIALKNRNNQIFEIEDSIAPIRNKQGFIIGAVFVFHDVTKQNQYRRKIVENEKMLIQQSKISAMAELLENMAHHWRQPLSIISTLATGIKLKKELNDLSEKYMIESLEKINDTSQNLSKVIDDFTIFLKPTGKKKEQFFIDNSLEKVLTILESDIKSKSIKIILDVEKILIDSYENELMQIFMGIINNSIDAVCERNDERVIFIKIYTKNKEIVISFLDNGGGISSDALNRVFEPYFTTKHKSQGKGISLYLIEEMIINQFKGKISVRNENFNLEDKEFCGAEFEITFKEE